MTQPVGQETRTLNDSRSIMGLREKSVLALDALATLTSRFADNRSLSGLVETLAYSVAGQFSVANAFVAVKNPDERYGPAIISGTGKFSGHPELAQLDGAITAEVVLHSRVWPIRVESLLDDPMTRPLAAAWQTGGVRLVAPFFSGDKLIGIMGLGNKVGGRSFTESDLDLAAAFVKTITPLVANASIFAEISYLNAWYLDILNSVKQAVLVIDEDGVIRTINAVGREMLAGISPAAVRGVSLVGIPIRRVFAEDIFPGWLKRLSRDGAWGPASRTENLIARVDGSERIFSVTIGTVPGSTAGRTDTIVTLHDVTTQKDVEQRLFDLERYAEKGMMASSIAHELNNFLGVILGGLELMQVYVDRGNVSILPDTLEKLKANVDKMARFTAGLMDYSRLEAKKQTGNLNAVLTDVMSFIAVQKRFTRIEVQTGLDPGLPDMEMDGDQLSQLLINLLNNAADAIAETGRRDGRIIIMTRHDDVQIILSIADNGTGIAPEVKERLFKEHLTTKETGHGYGLVTCSKIIANHRGKVDIESAPGDGTTFVFHFPRQT